MIKKVIVFDGTTEYSPEEITVSSHMRTLMNRALQLGGYTSLIDKINNEGGTAYITIIGGNWSVDLKNVSPELYSEFQDKAT